MPITRLESAGQMESILEDLKNSSGICIITKESLEMILKDNVSLHTATRQLNERTYQLNTRITESIEKLNSLYEANITEQSTTRNDLNQRLDTLIEKISMNNTLATPPEEINIEAELKRRKETLEKLTRNTELSKYYDELLNEPEPFVRPEYRTKVNKTTTERELVHRRQQAIDAVKTEIKIMTDRVTEYTEKKNLIDARIEEYLTLNEDKRTDIENQMTTQVRSTKDNFERKTITFMKNIDNEEKMNSYEYLIKVSDGPLNFRGQSSRSRPRGKSRRPNQRGY